MARGSLNDLRTQSEAVRTDSNNTLIEAQQILQEARTLENNITRVTSQDIISE